MACTIRVISPEIHIWPITCNPCSNWYHDSSLHMILFLVQRQIMLQGHGGQRQSKLPGHGTSWTSCSWCHWSLPSLADPSSLLTRALSLTQSPRAISRRILTMDSDNQHSWTSFPSITRFLLLEEGCWICVRHSSGSLLKNANAEMKTSGWPHY